LRGKTVHDAVALRARRIAEIVRERTSASAESPILRISATLSSLAISDDEVPFVYHEHDPEWEATFYALKEERRSIERWLQYGTVRLVISPDSIVQRIRYFKFNSADVNLRLKPRYEMLIDLIGRIHRQSDRLQVVYVPPYADRNVLIRNESVMIVGHERLSQTGFFLSTVYYDPSEISRQITSFDDLFHQAATVILHSSGRAPVDPEQVLNIPIRENLGDEVLGSAKLKKAVVAYLHKSLDEARDAGMEND
jgi:hypothetical protein